MDTLRTSGELLGAITSVLSLVVSLFGCASPHGWSNLDRLGPSELENPERTLSIAIVYVAGTSPEAAEYLDSLRGGKCASSHALYGHEAGASDRDDAVQAAVLASTFSAFSFWETFQRGLLVSEEDSDFYERVYARKAPDLQAFRERVMDEQRRQFYAERVGDSRRADAQAGFIPSGPSWRQSQELDALLQEAAISEMTGIKPIFVPALLVLDGNSLAFEYPDWADGDLEAIADVIIETALFLDECNAAGSGLIGRVGEIEWMYRVSLPQDTGAFSGSRWSDRDSLVVSLKGVDTREHVFEGIFRRPRMRSEDELLLLREARDDGWRYRVTQAMAWFVFDTDGRTLRFNDASIGRASVVVASDDPGPLFTSEVNDVYTVLTGRGGGYPLSVIAGLAVFAREAEGNGRFANYAELLGVGADRIKLGSVPEDELVFLETARNAEIDHLYEAVSRPALQEWHASDFGWSFRKTIVEEIAAKERLEEQRRAVAMAQSLAYMQGMQAMQSSPGSMQGYMTVAQATQVAQQAHAEISAASQEVQRNIRKAGAMQAEFSLEWAGTAHRISAETPAELREELRSLYRQLFGDRRR